MTRKLIIHDGHSERELLLIGTIVVGRDPTCHITDLDPLLSRRHAEFVTTADSVTIRDLGSRNGMLVNGEKVNEQVLVANDLVQLGHLQLRYIERLSVYTPEAKIRSHATTAYSMDAATHAAGFRPGAELEDTQPQARHEHATPEQDANITRAPGPRDPDATFAATASDADATVAPVRKSPTAPTAADLDATVAPGVRPGANSDRTFASGTTPGVDFDATFVPGAKKIGGDRDATFAPGATPAGVDLDATFVPGQRPLRPEPSRSAGQDAQLVAGHDMRVTTATDACRVLFGAAPDTLVGQSLGDLLAQSLQTVATGGPSSLSFTVERSPSDRTLTLTIKPGRAVESVS